MKLLVRMADDDGMLIGSQLETMIEPMRVENIGLETVYRFVVEYHELNKEEIHKYLRE